MPNLLLLTLAETKNCSWRSCLEATRQGVNYHRQSLVGDNLRDVRDEPRQVAADEDDDDDDRDPG